MTDSDLIVSKPEITLVQDEVTGDQISAGTYIGNDLQRVLQLRRALRMAIKEEKGRCLCAICAVPIYIVARENKRRFFFRHTTEDGSCPARTKGELTEDQINALRFHNQRESDAHIRMKEIVADSLRADSTFSEPVIEGTWKGRDGKEWRRPDVRSEYEGRFKVAFEVQLSTTFIRVMAERTVFYKSEGGLLLWILKSFDAADARLMQEDVFYNNNRNVFLVNDKTLAASQEAGTLMLECIWHEPFLNGLSMDWRMNRKMVRFDQLTIDLVGQRAFFFDAEHAEALLQDELFQLKIIQRPGSIPIDRLFQEFWLQKECFEGRPLMDWVQREARWEVLSDRFRDEYFVELPERNDPVFIDALRIIFLAKLGRSVGWNYGDKLTPATHHVATNLKPLLWLLLASLGHYGRLSGIEAADKKGRWKAKMADYERGMDSSDPAYRENHDYDQVLQLVFPEIEHLFNAYEYPF